MEIYEEIEKKILDSITPELEDKYFVLSEYFGDNYRGSVIGRISRNGYGNTALIFPLNDKRFPETKNFETLNAYYKDKGMQVLHLKEGLEVMFREKQIPGSSEKDCPELFESLNKWWDFWCIYARQFADEDRLRKSADELANAIKAAIDNVPLSNI